MTAKEFIDGSESNFHGWSEKVVKEKLQGLQTEMQNKQVLDVKVAKAYLQQLYDGVKDKSSKDAWHEWTKDPQDGRTAALMTSVQVALKALGYGG
jgi:hypothetical protein